MKVAIIHNQFTRSGGMESYLLTLVRGFLEAGDDVHLHVYKWDRKLVGQYACSVHKSFLSYFPRRFRKYVFLNIFNASFRRDEYDLSLSLTRSACQDIAVVGGVHPQSVLTRTSQNWYRKLHDRAEIYFEGKMFDQVPFIVAHSKTLKKEILHHYSLPPDKIHVLYPPIDERRFVCSGQEKDFNISEGKITFLLPSTGHQRKGLYELLQAFESLDPVDYELIVVGESSPRGFVPRENIRFLGYVDDMSGLYRAVDYLILPSHYEPFGLVVVEALECGTPVIITQAVGAAELITDQEGVILADNQPETLVQAINELEPRSIASGFAGRHGLETAQHIQALKNLVASKKIS